MQQILTLKLDSQLEQFLAQLAQQKNLSLNETALSLLYKAANLPAPSAHITDKYPLTTKDKQAAHEPIGDSLNHFFGSWSDEEYQAFQKTQEVFAEIDEELWL